MKLLRGIKYLFAIIGLGSVIAGGFAYLGTRAFIADANRADGKVIDLILERGSSNRTSSGTASVYKPLVIYQTTSGEKIEFLARVGSNPPSHHKGDSVIVLYQSENPQGAKIDSFLHLWFTASILGGMGFVFFMVGGGMIAWERHGRRKGESLRLTGQRILTKFQRVEGAGKAHMGRYRSFRIVTQWINPATSELHVFRSKPLNFDPGDHIKSDQVTVFIEKNNPAKYLVDVSFLPRLAG